MEALESRRLLSGSHHFGGSLHRLDSSGVGGYTPAQIRSAYGLDQVHFGSMPGNGAGQTIAIVDAFNDPKVSSDLHTFDQQFGLQDPPSLQVVNQSGSTSALPTDDPGWSQEISLDVQWAHASAPAANILLVEANSDGLNNLLSAVNYAKKAKGVSTVSMSWGGGEFWSESSYDSVFSSPANHRGVTFVAASGDSGSWDGPQWPASSANVLAVGGTTLATSGSSGTYAGETAWEGSGGGVSAVEPEPVYQASVQGTGGRSTPDVSLNADPNTGYAVYDSVPVDGQSGWAVFGGTSAAAPQWAGLIAIGDQGRVLKHEHTLDGTTGTLPLLYSFYGNASSYFHDVTSGMTSPFVSAFPGYDAATGLGSPKAPAIAQAISTADPSTLPGGAVQTAAQTTRPARRQHFHPVLVQQTETLARSSTVELASAPQVQTAVLAKAQVRAAAPIEATMTIGASDATSTRGSSATLLPVVAPAAASTPVFASNLILVRKPAVSIASATSFSSSPIVSFPSTFSGTTTPAPAGAVSDVAPSGGVGLLGSAGDWALEASRFMSDALTGSGLISPHPAESPWLKVLRSPAAMAIGVASIPALWYAAVKAEMKRKRQPATVPANDPRPLW